MAQDATAGAGQPMFAADLSSGATGSAPAGTGGGVAPLDNGGPTPTNPTNPTTGDGGSGSNWGYYYPVIATSLGLKWTTDDPSAPGVEVQQGTFRIARASAGLFDMAASVAIDCNYLRGTAEMGVDFEVDGPGDDSKATIPANQMSTTVTVTILADRSRTTSQTIVLEASARTPVDPKISGDNTPLPSDATMPIPPTTVVMVGATTPVASEGDPTPGNFTIARTGDDSAPLTVTFTIGGTAVAGVDYRPLDGTAGGSTTQGQVVIPAGQSDVVVPVVPIGVPSTQGDVDVTLSLQDDPNHDYVAGDGTADANGRYQDADAAVTLHDSPPPPPPPPPPPAACWRSNPGFITKQLGKAESGVESGLVPLGFTIDFYGQICSQLYVDPDGMVTFAGNDFVNSVPPTGELEPSAIGPYVANIATWRTSESVTYGTDVVDGHSAFGVDWNLVDHDPHRGDLTNSFQLVLIDRSDVGPGAFQIEFNYQTIQWECNFLNNVDPWGTIAPAPVAGYCDGNDQADSYCPLDGSGQYGGLLDSNPTTGLASHSLRSDVTGRYEFLLVPDLIQAVGAAQADAGAEYNDIVARFNDIAYPDAGPSDYAATIDWGDGTTTTGTISADGQAYNSEFGLSDLYDVVGDHTYDQAGVYPLAVTITSEDGEFNENLVGTASVDNPGLVLTSPGDQSSDEGDSVSLQVVASDDPEGFLGFDASGLPPGLTIDSQSGLISGTVAPGATEGGPYDVTVAVNDGTSMQSVDFAWDVAEAPVPTVSVTDPSDPTPGVPVPAGTNPDGFTIARNSGQEPLTVYFQLAGSAPLGTDYTATFGPGGGYIDDNTGQGYLVIPAGAATAPVIITAVPGGSDANPVELDLMGDDNESGGFVGYQKLPNQGPARMAIQRIAGSESGTIFYAGGPGAQDVASPVRFAEVDLFQTFDLNQAIASQFLGTTYTDANGNFSLADQLSTKGTGITAYVYTTSDPTKKNMQIINVYSWGQTQYDTFNQRWTPSPSNKTLTFAGGNTITADTASGRAFWVYDADVTAALFQATLPGFVQSTTKIEYPANGKTSWTWLGTCHILDPFYNSLDTIMHEYGHSVAQNGGFFPDDILFEGYLGHSMASNLRAQYGEGDPLQLQKLAFSEGWADFYSVAAQAYGNIGDGAFGGYLVGQNPEFAYGETDEVAVMRILWALADPQQTGTCRIPLRYGAYFGVQALYKLIVDNGSQNPDGTREGVRTLTDLSNALVGTTPLLPNGNLDVATLTAYGAVFAANGASPGTLQMKIGGVEGSNWGGNDPIPVFTWNISNGRGLPAGAAGHLLNHFYIAVFDKTPGFGYSTCYSSDWLSISSKNGQLSIIGNTAYWRPDDQAWKQILSTGSGTKTWVVWGGDQSTVVTEIVGLDGPFRNTTTFTSGLYWSDSSTFTVNP